MRSSALIAAALIAPTSALMHVRTKYEVDFINHAAKHDLTFADGTEFSQRLDAFAHNSDLIEAHNKGDHTFTLGHNEYSHLTFAEFEAMYLSVPAPRTEGSRMVNAFEGVKAAGSVDWSTTDHVTGVKDQGSCGSCWSFSTTGAVEGAYYEKYGKQVSFSEQQLVSCDTEYGDQGCNGGLMDNAFQYIAANGLTTEESYPYVSGDGSNPSCKSFTPVEGTKDITYTDIANSEEALAAAVSQQPIAVAVDADSNWQLYSGGILTVVSGTSLDHGVLAVGYGEEDGQAYWKIKNSWGSSWGESGYIRFSKDVNQANGPMGVTSAASYPTFA